MLTEVSKEVLSTYIVYSTSSVNSSNTHPPWQGFSSSYNDLYDPFKGPFCTGTSSTYQEDIGTVAAAAEGGRARFEARTSIVVVLLGHSVSLHGALRIA